MQRGAARSAADRPLPRVRGVARRVGAGLESAAGEEGERASLLPAEGSLGCTRAHAAFRREHNLSGRGTTMAPCAPSLSAPSSASARRRGCTESCTLATCSRATRRFLAILCTPPSSTHPELSAGTYFGRGGGSQPASWIALRQGAILQRLPRAWRPAARRRRRAALLGLAFLVLNWEGCSRRRPTARSGL